MEVLASEEAQRDRVGGGECVVADLDARRPLSAYRRLVTERTVPDEIGRLEGLLLVELGDQLLGGGDVDLGLPGELEGDLAAAHVDDGDHRPPIGRGQRGAPQHRGARHRDRRDAE